MLTRTDRYAEATRGTAFCAIRAKLLQLIEIGNGDLVH